MKAIFKPYFNQPHLVFFCLALCLIMTVYLHGSMQVRSDISFFLPESTSDIHSVMQHQLKQGEAGKIILIALQHRNNSSNNTGNNTGNNNSTLLTEQIATAQTATQQLAETNKKLALKLTQNKEFSLVQNGQLKMSSFIVDPYYQYRYLIHADNHKSFSTVSLTESFEQLLQRLPMMLSPVEQKLFAEDPQMIWPGLLKQWQVQHLQKRHGVWFDKQGEQSLLFVKTYAQGYELKQQQNNLDYIVASIKQIIPADGTIDFILTGAPVFALEAKKSISRQIKIISILASCTLMAFLYWFFRSIKIVFLAALPLGFAVLTGMTMVILTDGFIHGITIAFGITIIGIAVDYPVHFYSHSLLLKAHADNNNPASVMQSIWPMMRLGLITTLIGFSAITLSEFSGLRQLGLFALSGLFAAAMFTRFILPLFNITPSPLISSGCRTIQHFNQRQRPQFLRPLAIVLPVLALLFIIFNHAHLWQKDLSALSPIPQWQKQQDFELRKALGLPELRYALILQNASVEKLLYQSEQLQPQLDSLKQQGIISGYDMAARYLPSTKHQKEQQQQLPQSRELQSRLAKILQDSALDAAAFSPFIAAVDNSRHLQPLAAELLFSGNSNFITAKIKTLLYRPEKHLSSAPVWTAIIPLHGVAHELQKNNIMQQFSVPVSLLDLKTQSENMLSEYRSDALLWFFSGTILILLVLFFQRRQLSDLLPLAWPFTGAVILTIATLLMLGYSLSIFHLVTLLLVVGLGIDYSIFTFFSCRQANDMTQLPEVTQVSVIICLLSTLIMFGALALSDLPILKAIGLTASLGALYAFLLTLSLNKQL